jgi:cytochrome b561
LPDFMLYPPRIGHGLGAMVLIALVLAHVAAALYHQFVLRDRLLARMGLGRS